jgi:hypothetical protein
MRWKIPDWNPSKIAVGLALQERNAALTALEASLRAKLSKLQNQNVGWVISVIRKGSRRLNLAQWSLSHDTDEFP